MIEWWTPTHDGLAVGLSLLAWIALVIWRGEREHRRSIHERRFPGLPVPEEPCRIIARPLPYDWSREPDACPGELLRDWLRAEPSDGEAMPPRAER